MDSKVSEDAAKEKQPQGEHGHGGEAVVLRQLAEGQLESIHNLRSDGCGAALIQHVAHGPFPSSGSARGGNLAAFTPMMDLSNPCSKNLVTFCIWRLFISS